MLLLKGFYESLGYRALGDIYYDQHAKHIHMEKKLVNSKNDCEKSSK